MTTIIQANGRDVEYDAQAEAGIYLRTHERWWGSRIRWRFDGDRRWHKVLAVDVHPFDAVTCDEFVLACVSNLENE